MHPRGKLLCIAGHGFVRICHLETSQVLMHAVARLEHCANIGGNVQGFNSRDPPSEYSELACDIHNGSCVPCGAPVKVETLVDLVVPGERVEALLMDRAGKHLAALTSAVVLVWLIDSVGLREHALNSAPACKVCSEPASSCKPFILPFDLYQVSIVC
jgi:hypothetical protein